MEKVNDVCFYRGWTKDDSQWTIAEKEYSERKKQRKRQQKGPKGLRQQKEQRQQKGQRKEQQQGQQKKRKFDSFIEEICPSDEEYQRQKRARVKNLVPEDIWRKIHKEYLFIDCLVHIRSIVITYYRFTVVDCSDKKKEYYFRNTLILSRFDASTGKGWGHFMIGDMMDFYIRHIQYTRSHHWTHLPNVALECLFFN